MHQPQCQKCGRFVGRDVWIVKFQPVVVICSLCHYRDALKVKQESRTVARV